MYFLTREAIDLCVGKLVPGGVLVLHISNRYLELASVLAATAAERGLVTLAKRDVSITLENFRSGMRKNFLVAAVARAEGDPAGLRAANGRESQKADPYLSAWTGDFASVLAAMVGIAGAK